MGFIKISQARKEIVNFSRQHFYQLINEGKILAVKEPDMRTAPIMIDKDSLIKYLETIRVPMAL
jgi:hypothetical protein